MTATSSDAKSYLTALGAIVDERDVLLAEVGVLKAQLEAAKPKAKFTVGASTDALPLGTLPIKRTYSPTVIGSVPTQPTFHSFKQFVYADVVAWIKAAPKGQVISYFHEVEDNIENKTITPDKWVANVLLLCKAVTEAGRQGQVIPCVVMMGWSVDNRPAMLDQLLTNDVLTALRSLGGFVGFDRYTGTKTGAITTKTPQDWLASIINYAKKINMPWAVPETGSTIDATSVDSEHAAFWQSVFTYLESLATPPRFFIAWNPADSQYNIQSLPLTAAVWKAAMAKHPYTV